MQIYVINLIFNKRNCKAQNNMDEEQIPQECSTFWSFEQTEVHDDFRPVSVSVIYLVFVASQSPI